MFSVRIVTANHYQAQPIRDLDVAYSDFRGSEVKQVPVIRIFGATPVGQKTCLHIHGVFPYIYVRCGPQEFMTDKDLRQFATSLDLALQVAMGKASGNTHHVFKVVSVQAVPMYGYHSRSCRFLKVYFYNPLMVKRAVELLQSGAVMHKVFQPHEAHIPFILQFFIDYNLYGMNLIHLAAVKFRREKEENGTDPENSSPDIQPTNLSSMLSSNTISSQRWNRDNIPSGLLLAAEIQKQSVCELEVDAVAVDILNRHELQANTEMNPGLLAIYNDERERREVKGQLDDLHPPSSPDRGVIQDTDSEVNGKARLADIIQKQLSELRALAGGHDGEDDDDSVLQDTMAEPSLTANQLILHDSQYAGDGDSVSSLEESQPVVNEELVQLLVEASQRSSQYSQQAGEKDQDLAQLLVDLAQDEASPEDGSILSSQQTQDDERKQNKEDEEEREDARESLEMSQAWQEGSDEEDTTEQSHATHDISASEEDTQGSQAVIPQFDGGSDDKPAPIKKKSLGMRHQLQKSTPNIFPNPMDGSSTSFSPFPPEIKTYANKKLLINSPEKAKEHPGLTAFQTFKTQKAVFQHTSEDRSSEERSKQVSQAKATTSPSTVRIHKILFNPTKVGSAVSSKATLQTKLNSTSSGVVSQDNAALKRHPSGALSKSSSKESSKGCAVVQDKAPLKRHRSEVIAQSKNPSKRDTTKPVFQDQSSLKKVSSKVVVQNKTVLKRHSSELVVQDKSSSKRVSPKEVVSDEAFSNRNPTSATKCVPPHQTDSSAPELLKVPLTTDTHRLAGCRELKNFSSLDKVKKDPSWNPVVMLIKCPIETNSKGKVIFSRTSLPQKQLEQIRRDKLEAQPFRRSSFSRKIVPPKKFMDEQYWMDQILKMSKKKSEDASKITSEPPCLLSPGYLEEVKDNQHMPILEKMTSTNDTCVTHNKEKHTVITKTKAMLQKKCIKSLSSPDKKNKLSKNASHKKLCSKTDAKRYGMLSRTFNKLSLSTHESSSGGTSVGTTQPTLNTGTKLSITKTETSFVSCMSESSLNDSSRNASQSIVQSSHAHSIMSPHGHSNNSSTSSVPQDTTQQIKKRSSGTRRRRVSDSSDDWVNQNSPSHKRKSSHENQSEELIFGRSYRFRKRERISYDDDDFPDVGFDIMCWSDQEGLEDTFSQTLHEQHEIQRVKLQSGTRPESQQELQPELHPVESSIKSSTCIHSSDQTKEATLELPLSPPRKRGRPSGSKNKSSKFLKSESHFPKAGDGKSSPSSRSKPHLSFTIDSMLHNGAKHSPSWFEPVSTGSSKPISITATSHSSVGGLLASSPTVTQARMGQPTVSHSHAIVTTSEGHRSHSRTQPIPTAVNGHHSNVHDDSSEPTLYRDAMWNLGYFSPRRKEKEGSPPRCWSPSSEMERSTRSQQTPEMNIGTKQNHKPSKVKEQGERSNITKQKQGHKKKKRMDSHSWSYDRGEKSHNGSVQTGNRTNYKQLMTYSNSRTGRGPESKQSCNIDIFDKGGLMKTETSKFCKKQENSIELEEQKTEVKTDKKKEATSIEDGKVGIKPSCPGDADDVSFHDNSPRDNLATDVHNSEIGSQRILVDKDISRTMEALNSSSVSGKSTYCNTSPGMEIPREDSFSITTKYDNLEKNTAPSVNTLASGITSLANRQKQMKTSSPTKPAQECKDRSTTPSAHCSTCDQGSGLEFKGQNQPTMDDIADASMSKVSLQSRTSAQRVNGITLTEDIPDGSGSRILGDTQTASPYQYTTKGPSSSSPPESPKLLITEGHSDDNMTLCKNQSQGNQKKHSDYNISTPADLDDQICDSVRFSPRGSESSSGTHDEKALDGRASHIDLDRSLYSSSDDITPAQRKRKSPIEEDEDSDDICNVSNSSSSTGASLSLDVSLIISRVPSISPTRDLDSEGSSFLREKSQSQLGSLKLFQEKIVQDRQEIEHKACSWNESACQLSQSRDTPEVLDLTSETHRSRSQSDHELTGEGSLAYTMTSGNHAAASNGSSSDALDYTLACKSPFSTGTDKNSLLVQGSDHIKRGSKSDSSGDDSDTFSQLFCPETPSPRSSNDDALSKQSQQKPDSQTDEPTTSCKQSCVKDYSKTPGGDLKCEIQPPTNPKSKIGSADEKLLRISSTETSSNEPLRLVAETKKESASKSDRPGFPICKEVVDSDEEMEAMEIDTSQEESENPNEAQQSSDHIKKFLEKSHHRGDSRNPCIAVEATDETLIVGNSERASASSQEDHPLESGQYTRQAPPLDSGRRERFNHDPTVVSNLDDKMSTLPSGQNEATEAASKQNSHASPKPGSVSALGVDCSQAAETLDEVVQPSKLSQFHSAQGEMDAWEGRNQTLHSSAHGSQMVPVRPQTPVASSQVPTQDAYSTHSPAQDVEKQNMTLLTETKHKVFTPAQCPPSAEMVRASLQEFGLPQLHHQRVFCGNPDDVHQPSRPGVHDKGYLQINLPSHLPEAESRLSQTGLSQWQANLMALKPHPLLSPSNVAPESGLKAALVGDTNAVITPCRSPPSIVQVQGWLNEKNEKSTEDKKEDNEVTNGEDGDGNLEETNVSCDLADKPSTSKVEFEGDTEMHSNATLEVEHEAVSSPRTSLQLQDKPSASQVKTSGVILKRWPMNSTPSSKPVSSPQEGMSVLSPNPWNKNSSQSQADTPRINPFIGRGGSLPRHSTPLRINTQREEGGIPVTPVSGWKQPTNPSSAGGSRERQSSSFSMRQTLLFTPKESSGVGRQVGEMSQIEGATPSNTCGFKMPQLNMQAAKAVHEVQHLTVMSLELHVKTRRDYHPDPDFDPIRALFYSIQHDAPPQAKTTRAGCSRQQDDIIHGVIVVEDGNHINAGPSTSSCPQASLAHSGISNIHTTSVATENELLDELLSVVRKHDPDILVGYEVQQHSWGYLLERAAFLDVDLCTQISRLPEFKKESSFSSERDSYGADHHSEINIAGRITLNLWRLMRHEVALTNYTFENVAFHVLHQRIPQFTYRKLTDWFDHRNAQLYRWRVIEYYSVRVRGSLKLLHQLDLIGRTSELARVFGMQFYSVLSRGTQFRVESMMLRTAKPQNYVAMSPSVQQRSRMKAPECIALVMEPESRFYQDPVIVLDFQSLYPTMMIAYNYCYSTCLGRLEHIANGGEYVLGCGSLSIPSSQLKKLLQSDSLHVSPNGIVFVKSSVRRGVLPTMLEQILKLRLIVKKALKDFKEDKTLHRMLDSRQLALKLIANVTYGYTSANYSGRMPCIEVGDSVVRKGRETLERAIHMVETTKKWGARVVYGDTDSMFVLVEGVSKERAFEVGREIRDAVTAANPKPVKLKLEKVYHPCVLQSKKRYVGYSYESPDQVEPDFDAKGIETVRRDSCPAVGKILERALKVLFTMRDVSQVKQYVQKQFQKILDGQATMQDLIFAKEYRGRHTYRPGACVPALEISRRLLAVDRRAEPRVGQRVPYVIVHGSPGLPLIQLVRMPSQVLQNSSLRLNTTYYLTRQLVPSLNRVFGLLGVDTMQWYQELPRWHRITAHHQPGTPGKKGTISQYFASLNCVICEKVTKDSLCSECKAKGQVTATALMSRVQQWQLVQLDMAKICASCCNFSEQDTNGCVSLDCPIMFKTNKLSRQLGQAPYYLQLLDGL